MSSDPPVSEWLAELASGSSDAAEKIFGHYYGRVIELVRNRLPAAVRRAFDEEDVALSAFGTFIRRAQQGEFKQLENRDDLWKLLITIAFRKASTYRAREVAQKRGGGALRGDSVFRLAGRGFDTMADDAASPDEIAETEDLADQVVAFLLSVEDFMLLDVAIWKSAGRTHKWIAEQMECSPKTIERKLKLLRQLAYDWADRGEE